VLPPLPCFAIWLQQHEGVASSARASSIDEGIGGHRPCLSLNR
jgi:hypothetical protein